MYVRIEPTGCLARKGLVQIRFCMYLDEGDYGYEKHRTQVPERPLTDKELADQVLADLVPKVWQTNPFHNHFIYVEFYITDKEIMNIGEAFLKAAYAGWSCNERLVLRNQPVRFHEIGNKTKVEAKVRHLKETKLERKL